MGLGDKSGSASDGGLWELAGSNTVLYWGDFVGWGRVPVLRELRGLGTSDTTIAHFVEEKLGGLP